MLTDSLVSVDRHEKHVPFFVRLHFASDFCIKTSGICFSSSFEKENMFYTTSVSSVATCRNNDDCTLASFSIQSIASRYRIKPSSIYPKCYLTSSQVHMEAVSSAFCHISSGSLLTLLYFLCNQDNGGKGAISPNFTEESSASSRCPACTSGRASLQSVTLL